MDHSFAPESTHPVLLAAGQIAAALKDVRDTEPGFMAIEDKRAALVLLPALRDQVEALWLRVVDGSDDVAEQSGARDVGAWLTAEARLDRSAAASARHLARALSLRWHQVDEGVRDGEVAIAQARSICGALDSLAEAGSVAGDVLEKAEAQLVLLARDHTPSELRRLGERILSIVAPQVQDERDRLALEAAERRASSATRLSMRRRGDGSTDLHARLPDAVAARLKTCLDAYTSPRTAEGREGGVIDPATGQRLPHARLLGQAFCSLLEAIPADAMPLHGGSATTVVVTIDLEALRSGLGLATTGDGTTLTAGEARRLACQAGLIPAVLGGKSEPLDLGRRRRLFSPAQRLALAMQHPTCRAEGCTVPATWCEAHHWRRPWVQDGRTDLADGKLLCPWHHHRAHDPLYETRNLPDGGVRFHRRP